MSTTNVSNPKKSLVPYLVAAAIFLVLAILGLVDDWGIDDDVRNVLVIGAFILAALCAILGFIHWRRAKEDHELAPGHRTASDRYVGGTTSVDDINGTQRDLHDPRAGV